MKPQIIVWNALFYTGMEYLTLVETPEAVEASGVVIGVFEQAPFHLDYRLTCDASYAVRSVNLALADGRSLRMTTDGHGHWFDADGQPLAEFDGCFDIDISTTPFTNTLPIRRMNWQVGQAEVLRMIYIRIPHLTPRVVQQRYTCLEQTDGGATFRYESLDSGFTANLPVDATGVVLDYPNIWERVYPKADRG